jgi:DNA-binding transcriptional ArsR family regulator
VNSFARLLPVFAALADRNRVAILDRLRDGPMRVGDLCAAVGATQPLISFHLKVLRDAGLVLPQRDGRAIWYAIDPVGLSRLEQLVRTLSGGEREPTTASLEAELEICRTYINVG